MEKNPALTLEPEEVVWGLNTILECLHAGRRQVRRLYVGRGLAGVKEREILRLAQEKGVAVAWKKKSELSSLAGTKRHQGMVALVERLKVYGLDEVLQEVREGSEPALLLVLDGIQDAGNLGSILRVAETVGADAVVLPKSRSAKLGAGAAKSSAGAIEHVRIVQVSNLRAAMKAIREAGIWLVGADEKASRVYYDTDLSVPLALVVGGEEKGLRRLTRENCDLLVKIPMRGRIGSLNAAVAAAVIAFEIARQRAKKGVQTRKDKNARGTGKR